MTNWILTGDCSEEGCRRSSVPEDCPEREFQEWMDDYWAKDIQELFRLERRFSFQRFAELLFTQSGGIYEATKFAAQCEASRTTISNYLAVLEATYVIHIVRPFSTRRRSEILSALKSMALIRVLYVFIKVGGTSGSMISGLLWEHYVLNELQGRLQIRNIHYWRDKQNHEVDFIWPKQGRAPRSPSKSNGPWGNSTRAFRRIYKQGSNFVVCHDVTRPYRRLVKDLDIELMSLEDLILRLKGMSA